MSTKIHFSNCILDNNEIVESIKRWGNDTQIVFTNGCFDLLHLGHIDYLFRASQLGDKLIVGLNSDASIRRIKGENRPIQDEISRASVIAALQCVDAVVLFHENTPLKLVELIQPHTLVKGADYKTEDIVGSDFVLSKGGSVQTIPFLEGYSTTSIIKTIKNG